MSLLSDVVDSTGLWDVGRLSVAIIKAHKESKNVRWATVFVFCISIPAFIFAFVFISDPQLRERISIGFAIYIGAYFMGVGLYRYSLDMAKDREKFIEKEKEVEKHPEKTKLAWDIAQEKLEIYLNRNLSQVRSIYLLCVLVMLVGFGLIGFGVYMIYSDPEQLKPSALSSISGILVSFLGGSFLFIYKSTMNQAKEYVSMLERINAVGMSLQILDSMKSEDKTKEKTKAEIAKELLQIYSKK